MPNPFPSLKAREMLRVLAGLGYTKKSQAGSHIKLVAEGRPQLTFAFHQGDSIPPGVVREILIKQVGLDPDEALKAVHGDI